MKSISLIRMLVEKELKELVGPDGGIMDPGMVPFVPHREPAADTADEPEEPSEEDALYKLAVRARLATEELVRALDNPIHDQAYESAFKATSCLRDALNALIGLGADPEREDHIVAPDVLDQPLGSSYGTTFMPMTYTGDTVSEGKTTPDVAILSKALGRIGFADKVRKLIDKPIEVHELLNGVLALLPIDSKMKVRILNKIVVAHQSGTPAGKTGTQSGTPAGKPVTPGGK